VDAYSLDTVGCAMASTGMLSFQFRQKDLPPEVPFALNTSDFQELLPGLYDRCADCEIQVNVMPASPPVFLVTPRGVAIQAPFYLNISYIPRTARDRTVLALTIAAPIIIQGSAGVTPDSFIVGKVTDLECPLRVAWSDIGPASIEDLQPLVDMILETQAVPQINALLAKGMPIPVVAGISLDNPVLTFYEGFLSVSTRFKYQP